MKYHLITATMPITFDAEVNGHLRYGWQLWGDTFTDPRSGALCQAVIKPDQPQQEEEAA